MNDDDPDAYPREWLKQAPPAWDHDPRLTASIDAHFESCA